MRLFFIFFFSTIIALNVNAQRDYIEVSNEVKDDRYEFYGINTSSRVITVVVFFPKLQYLRSTSRLPFVAAIQPGRKRLFQLEKDGTGTPDFSYRYWSFYGVANPKVKDVLYAMPFKAEGKIKVMKVQQARELLGQEGTEGFRYYSFRLEPGTVITAARGGRIERIVSDNQGNDNSLDYTRKRNQIEVRHKDGTLGVYQNFANGSSKVKKGDDVLTGQALALADDNSKTGRGSLIFGITYLEVKVEDDRDPKEWSTLKYVHPKFKLQSGEEYIDFSKEYGSFVDEALITQEMSKREKKKYLKSKN